MQTIPGHTGPSLLAAWWYSGENKGQEWDRRCNEHLKKMIFKDLLETFLLTSSEEGEKKSPDKDEWQGTSPQSTHLQRSTTLAILTCGVVLVRSPLSCWVS